MQLPGPSNHTKEVEPVPDPPGQQALHQQLCRGLQPGKECFQIINILIHSGLQQFDAPQCLPLDHPQELLQRRELCHDALEAGYADGGAGWCNRILKPLIPFCAETADGDRCGKYQANPPEGQGGQAPQPVCQLPHTHFQE